MSISTLLVIITCIVSILSFSNQVWMYKLKFNPYLIQKQREWYRFFSYALVHADYFHLAVNAYVLYSFGSWVEYFFLQYFQEKATLYFLLLYVGGTFLSVVPSFEKHKNHNYYNAVGASGAVSAVVFSAILFDPLSPMGLLFLPFRFPAFVFGLAYLIYSYYMSQKANEKIGHDAHFFGALFGIMFTIFLNKTIAINFFYQIVYWFSR